MKGQFMKVLNFGSLNIDFVYNVEHFVKKGETISSTGLNTYSGGKGMNQSIALSRAGVSVYHAGRIGEDGKFLKELLKKSGVDTRFIAVSETVRTGNAIIQKDGSGDNCIILYSGANAEITKKMIDSVLESFGSGDWLILQNEISEIPYLVERAHEKGMKIILNPSPMDEKIFQINLKLIDCLILNEGEAQELIGHEVDRKSITEALQRRFTDTEIILTLGEKGSVYISRDSIVKRDAYHVKPVDTTAAGDTFTGYYLAGRIEGKTIKESLDQASKAAAAAVGRSGAAVSIPWKQEIM